MAQHDPHILELFVLGGLPPAARPEEIRSHLAACAGCRAMEQEIRGFYDALEEEEWRAAVHETPLSLDDAGGLHPLED